jgi:subtilisin-like proprotein convertase family protein
VAVSQITTQPDLEVIIRDIESDATNLYIYYTIYNNGIDASGSILLDAWSDLAAAPTLGEPATASKTIADVPGYGSVLGTFIIPETAVSGTAYLAVDTANTAVEKNEDNNISAAAPWVATEPDLQVSIENVYADGTNTIIKYRLQNTGSRDAGDYSVQVWANPASAPVVGDLGDTSESFFSMSAGANFTRTVTVPNTDASGTAYAIIDSQDIVSESDETNNVSAGLAWVITYPDLQVTVDAVSSNGTNIEIDYTVTNGLENYAPAFNVDFFSDSSGAPSVGMSGEYSVSHSGLAPGESVSDTAVFSSALPSGTAYAVVDTGGLVTETNDANNVSNGLAWTASYPDLQVVVERVISDGVNADVRVEIRNAGPGDAGSFDVELWAEAASAPTMGDVGDTTETFNFTSFPLSAGAYTSRVITMPVTQANAIAYAIVDTGNLVAETDETNNISPAKEWATTYFSPDTFQTIPDADLVTGVSANINLTGVTTSISRMVVGVNIWHDHLTEIDIYLESPTGTMIELSTDNDGCGSGYYGDSSRDTLFDDLATKYIATSNDCYFLDAYKPEQALSTLNGEDANGIWTLHVYDDDNTYSFPEGTMRSFSVSVW